MLPEKIKSLKNYKAQDILLKVLQYSNSTVICNQEDLLDNINPIHEEKIIAAMSLNKKLEFILPAFPAKSANRKKTTGDLPDYGEVLALERLNKLCSEIQEIYQPGAKIIICSDGRVFSDLVLVSDESVSAYQYEIRVIIDSFNFTNLDTFNLEGIYSSSNFSENRKKLVHNFGKTIEQVREEVRSDRKAQNMFNGIHRFLVEDRLELLDGQSKNKIREGAKEISYEVIQRSNAWSSLLEKYFSIAVRLSIHPQLAFSKKIGFRLVESANAWATPWHNVVCREKQKFTLMKKIEAERIEAKLCLYQGKYAYYQIEGV